MTAWPADSLVRAIWTWLPATAARMAPHACGRLTFARRLTQYCRDRLALRRSVVAVRRRSFAKPHIVSIGRKRNRITVGCPDWMVVERPNEFLHRLCGVLAIAADAPLDRLRLLADLSDGEDSGPGLLSFCSRDHSAILIPDHIFVRTRGYEEHRRVARVDITEWNTRSDRIVWRGQTTGVGTISKPHLSAHDPGLLPRVRLCLALKGERGTDVRLSTVSQSSDRALDTERLAEAGILGEFISPIAWHRFKFAIDIDGNTNSWTNFFTRLIMGCCVLKVGSALGYRQWYYGEIKPWVHYVPVKPDLSDLLGRIAWCRENLAECRQIAARGQAFAMARDLDTEVAGAVGRVCEAYKSGALRASGE